VSCLFTSADKDKFIKVETELRFLQIVLSSQEQQKRVVKMTMRASRIGKVTPVSLSIKKLLAIGDICSEFLSRYNLHGLSN